MKKHTIVVAAMTLLVALFAQTAGADADASAKVFKTLDADGDGYVTKEEAEINAEISSAFDDGDTNEDGKLDMVEFEKLDISED